MLQAPTVQNRKATGLLPDALFLPSMALLKPGSTTEQGNVNLKLARWPLTPVYIPNNGLSDFYNHQPV